MANKKETKEFDDVLKRMLGTPPKPREKKEKKRKEKKKS